MSAAGCSGAGSYSDGNPVKPPHPGIVTTPKVRKSKSKPPDRAASESPDSTLTTAEAPSRGGDNGVKELDKTATAPAASSRGVEELQQQTNGKKPRLVWTPELHDNFVRAYTSLGGRDAVPKKILGLMNVNGLTRENVASHLQKYRDNLQGKGSLPKSLQGKGKSVRRRGNNNGGATTTMRRTAPSLQPNFPQIQPIAAAFPQAASPSPSANPPPPPQRSFAAANMFHPQIGRGQGQIVHALPASLHQPHPNFPMAQAPMSPLLYRRPQLQAAMVERQRRMFMEHQARAQHAARMKNKAAVVPGHNHHTFLMNCELGAQTLPLAPGAAAAAVSGVHGHHLEQSMQASRAVNMSGGFCSVPEASMRHEQMETHMGVAQLQIGAEAEAGGQAPGAEPAFAGSADPDGGQQEEACGVLRFWNTVCAPSMDHEFPPNKPT